MSDVTRRARYILSADDQTKGALQSVNRGISSVTSALGTLGVGLSAASFVAFAKQAGDAAMQLDRLESRFRAATGSFEGGRRELEFVRQTASRLGLDLMSAADSYSGLTAAAQGTSLAGQAVRDIFDSVAQTSAILGLSSDQTQGALLALEQMMSKGTVQAEELRGQLGERLPGSFRIAAEAMGVTTAELGKMLEQGQVVAADFLPKFAVALRNNYQGEIPEHVKALGNIKTAFFELQSTIGRAGVQDTIVFSMSEISQLMVGLNFVFQDTSRYVRTLTDDFNDLGSSTGLQRFLAALPGLGPAYGLVKAIQTYGEYRTQQTNRMAPGSDNLDPTAGVLPFSAASIPAATTTTSGNKAGKAAKDDSPKPFEDPLTTIGQAGVWESIAQARIDAESRSLQAQVEFDAQRFASAVDIGNQMQDLWLIQANEKEEINRRGREAETQAERDAAARKAMIWQGSAATFLNIGASLQTLSAGQSKKMFEVAKAASIGGALISTYEAAQKAYAAYAAFPPLAIAAASAATLAGLARVNAIRSTQFGGSGGGVQAGGGASYGNFSGGGPPTTTVDQPKTQVQGPQEITIRLIGGVSDAYVEDEIIPRIINAQSRNVRIEFARD